MERNWGRKPELQDITSETKATSSTYGSTDKAVINFFRADNPEIIWNFNTAPTSNSTGKTFYGLFCEVWSIYCRVLDCDIFTIFLSGTKNTYRDV